MSKYKMKPKEVVCSQCGKSFMMKYYTWAKNTKRNMPFRCKECLSKWQSERNRQRHASMSVEEKSLIYGQVGKSNKVIWANKSNDEKEQFSKLKKSQWENRSDEEKTSIGKKISNANKQAWANKSDEEKQAISDLHKQIWTDKSDEELKSWSKFKKDQWANKSEEEMKAWSNLQKEIWANKSDKDKEAYSEFHKQLWLNMSDEERHIITERMSQSQSDRWNSLSDNEKEFKMQPLRDGWDQWHSSLSDEERNILMLPIHVGWEKWWASLSDAMKKSISDKISNTNKEKWALLSDEEKRSRIQPLRDGWEKWWNSLSDEEMKSISDAAKERWANKSDEEKKSQIQPLRDGRDKWWSSLSDEERRSLYDNIAVTNIDVWANKSDKEKKIHGYKVSDGALARQLEDKIQTANKRDKNGTVRKGTEMVKWFTDMLHTHYDTTYTTDGDHAQHNQDARNMDITIYRDGNPIMVVELDDLWTHGDGINEYGRTGRHYGIGSEYRDVERGLSIPDGIPFMVICEDGRDDYFNDLMEVLDRPYEEFVQWMFRRLRLQPFPYPSYSNTELVKSFTALRNRMKPSKDGVPKIESDYWDSQYGMHMVYHFHPSIWHDSIPDHMCPYDAYMDDDILMDMIKSHMVIHTRNRNKITQCFLLSDMAPRVPIFTPIMAMKVMCKYCMEYDTIVDASMGYGGTMLATIAMGKSYVGYDTDIAHVNEANHMVNWIRAFMGLDVNAHLECNEPHGIYPCMVGFTTIGDDQIKRWMDNIQCGKYVFVTTQPTDYPVVNTFRYDKAYCKYDIWRVIVINN